MKKSYWKQRANRFEGLLIDAQRKVRALGNEVSDLTRELEDKRKNWAPIKMKHPYVPVNAKCIYCDDPAEDPRHEDKTTKQVIDELERQVAGLTDDVRDLQRRQEYDDEVARERS